MIRKIINHLLWRYDVLTNIIIPERYYTYKLPKQIMAGPFAGMKYANAHPPGGVILPKIIGTYEDEIEFVWEEARQKKYDAFIDVGAGEGYYSVGIKKYIFPNIPSIGFEMQAANRRGIKRLAKHNNVDVVIKGTCNLPDLKSEIEGKKILLLMDVEGYERELLNTTVIDFSGTDIIVEVHPLYDEELEQKLINRFEGTHTVKVIQKSIKKLPNLQYPEWVYKKSHFVMDEFRGPQSWLWITAN